MDETFYGVLGIDSDADEETIDRAFRELVKAHHPDVSDDPDASVDFRRLTTAREVLLDQTERARYDRLGHARYVRRYAGGTVWQDSGASTASADEGSGGPTVEQVVSDRRSEGTASPGPVNGGRRRGSVDGTAANRGGTTANRGGTTTNRGGTTTNRDGTAANRGGARVNRGGTTANRGGTRVNQATSAQPGTTGSYGGVAAEYYRPAERLYVEPQRFTLASLRARLDAVGPWLLIDGLLMIVAIWTAWVLLVLGSLSLVSVLAATVLLVVTLAVSALHLSIKAYS